MSGFSGLSLVVFVGLMGAEDLPLRGDHTRLMEDLWAGSAREQAPLSERETVSGRGGLPLTGKSQNVTTARGDGEIVRRRKPVYCDPIYKIPHFHDPALTAMAERHDPRLGINRTFKEIGTRASERLRAAESAGRVRLLHTRHNMDTLLNSPLMAFPHFEEMTAYLEAAQSEVHTGGTAVQKAAWRAKGRFCAMLFLMLQEVTRSLHKSPSPLVAIWRWFQVRDLVMNAQLEEVKRPGQEDYIVLDFGNGEELRVPKHLFGPRLGEELDEMFTDEALEARFAGVPMKVAPPPPPVVEPPHHTRIVTRTPALGSTSGWLPSFGGDSGRGEDDAAEEARKREAAVIQVMIDRHRRRAR